MRPLVVASGVGNLAEDSDHALVARVREAGDEDAFRELYRRHTPKLFRLVLRLAGGRESDAMEIVQDTWVSAVESFRAFRGDALVSTWLSAIAINRVRDAQRRKKRWRFLSLATSPEPFVTPRRLDDRMDIETTLAQLAPGHRAVLVLHDIEGYTHEEIARLLGVTAGTSKAQLFNARHAMRRLLCGEGKDG
jgi:RNA polymerase sigma-70 factor (ECF subfamily)